MATMSALFLVYVDLFGIFLGTDHVVVCAYIVFPRKR
jgi:hypothetical protein